MKYRVVYYPWDSILPYKLEFFTEEAGWERSPGQSFADLAQADRYINSLKRGPEIVREFEL